MLGLAPPARAAMPAAADVQLVAQAIERRGVLLADACGAGAQRDSLGAATGQLGNAASGVALAAGVAAVVRAAEEADAAADDCAAALPHLPAGPVRYAFDPARIAGAADRIRAWGEDEAAGAWARIAAAGAPRRNDRGAAEVCRCFGEAVRGVRIVYGYPTAEMTAWLRSYELLGELRHGGCELGSPLACPDGCWPDRVRLGDPHLPPRDSAWQLLGELQLGVAGDRAAVPGWAPDPNAAGALSACLGDRKLARARRAVDGAWAPWDDSARDMCVAAWAEVHLTDARIDRLAVLRAEEVAPPDR